MDSTGLALGALGLAAGGVLKGATGAGAPIIAVPLIAMLYDVRLAVVLFTLPNLFSNLLQAWQYRQFQRSRLLVWGFAAGGVAGAAIGTMILAHAPSHALLLGVSGAVFAYIAFRMLKPNWAMPYATGRTLALPAGFGGGLLQGAAGISAPISITFLNAMKLERGEFIGTISVFFTAMSVPQLILLSGYGLMTPERAGLSLLGCLPLFGAMPVGAWLARYISRAAFDKIILGLLAVVALRLTISALG